MLIGFVEWSVSSQINRYLASDEHPGGAHSAVNYTQGAAARGSQRVYGLGRVRALNLSSEIERLHARCLRRVEMSAHWWRSALASTIAI